MYAVFPDKNLYDVIEQLCEENSIARVNNLILTLHNSSRINERSIREYFRENNSRLIGEWTNITVEKRKIEKLKAIIQRIDGEPDRYN